jgi:hypothetical protein
MVSQAGSKFSSLTHVDRQPPTKKYIYSRLTTGLGLSQRVFRAGLQRRA